MAFNFGARASARLTTLLQQKLFKVKREEERSRAFPRDVVKRLMFRVLNYFWVLAFCVCLLAKKQRSSSSSNSMYFITRPVLSLVLSLFILCD